MGYLYKSDPHSLSGNQITLRNLAKDYGMQTSYYDVSGHRRQASAESLFLVLRALGAPIDKFTDLSDAWRERKLALIRQGIEPVMVSWEGGPITPKLKLPRSSAHGSMMYHLGFESGEIMSRAVEVGNLETRGAEEVEGVTYVTKELWIAEYLPWGYHHLTVEIGSRLLTSKIISAPVKAYGGKPGEKIWGVFLPLYALHSRKSWGAGDFSDLEALDDWISQFGGKVVATLPFLAAFLGELYDPSPYSPASRLFWNEFYLNLGRVPELKRCTKARHLMKYIEDHEVEEFRSSPLVDYDRQMALKRKVLEELSTCFFDGAPEQDPSFQSFVTNHPAVEDYACFRAAGKRLGLPWPEWPHPLRDGILTPGDYREQDKRYHLYVQWLAHEQIQSLSARLHEKGPGLYLDLPLGVHPHAYDTWRKRDLFPEGIAGGAPPDVVFTNGQNWGFPPLHPERIRKDGYSYVMNFLSHIMEQAGILRIDHVMGLHRIYWIPKELEASQGVYVRYPAEELYAILSLESHRNNCLTVGENLGTVPSYVNQSMRKHNIKETYVVHYELESKYPGVLRKVPARAAASLNTHDMPPFSAFWEDMDIHDRQDAGLLDEEEVRNALNERQETKKNLADFLYGQGLMKEEPAREQSVLKGCLAYLSASPAHIVLVNMEDLWLEKQPQNLPGSSGKRPNWKRKARYSLEEMQKEPRIAEILEEVNRLRERET
ncbi:MAG: 4-alpha-glucanotransferase [bacterium]